MVLAAAAALIGAAILAVYLIVRGEELRLLKRDTLAPDSTPKNVKQPERS